MKPRLFDFVVSRAVAPIKDLWQWSRPFIKKGHDHEHANGLICLKGGDLAQEISESQVRPHLLSIYDIFKEDYFQEKYLVHVAR